MKPVTLMSDRLPGTIGNQRITIETPWGPMADSIGPGIPKVLLLAIAVRRNKPMPWRVARNAHLQSGQIRGMAPISTSYQIYSIRITGNQS